MAKPNIEQEVLELIEAMASSHSEYNASDFKREFETVLDRRPTITETTYFLRVAADCKGTSITSRRGCGDDGGDCGGSGSGDDGDDDDNKDGDDSKDDDDNKDDDDDGLTLQGLLQDFNVEKEATLDPVLRKTDISMNASKPTFVKARPGTAGNQLRAEVKVEAVHQSQKNRILELLAKMRSSPSAVGPSLRELTTMCRAIDVAVYFVEAGMAGDSDPGKARVPSLDYSVLRFFSPGIGSALVEEAFNLLDTVISHKWPTGEQIVKSKFWGSLLASVLGWLKDVRSPADYSPTQLLMVQRLCSCMQSLDLKCIPTIKAYLKEGSLLYFLHLLRIHTESFLQLTSSFHKISLTLINGCSRYLMSHLSNGLLSSSEEISSDLQRIALSLKPVNGYDLLFGFFQKGNLAVQKFMTNTAGYCVIILGLLLANSDVPMKYVPILPELWIILETSEESSVRVKIIQIVSLYAFMEGNRVLVQNAGLGTSVFDILTKPSSPSTELKMSANALVNLTNVQDAETRNQLINEQAFTKLKVLLDRMSANKEGTDFANGDAAKNAVVIELVFLILGNLFIDNATPLVHAVNAGLHAVLVDYLGGTDDAKRIEAGHIVPQQKAALTALHSFTFHQSDHISTLVAYFVLTKLKAIIRGGRAELAEQALTGVLWNIAVKGSAGSVTQKEEKQKNNYLTDFRSEGIVTALSQLALSTSQVSLQTKRYAALILAQLYRNCKLETAHQHIVPLLKAMKNGVDTDLSFKALNAIEMLKEDSNNSTMIGIV